MSIRRRNLLANVAKSVALVVVLVLATYSVLATRARSSAPANSLTDPTTVTTNGSVTQAEPSPQELTALLLTIRPTGFDPAEITLPAGEYLVIVRNSTGLDEFALRLDRDAGERLHDVRMPRYKRRWKQVVSLSPGSYVVTETNHPQWTCRITVTGR